MKNSSASGKQAATVILILIIFLAVLAASVLIQLVTSPTSKGFGSESPVTPGVTYLPGDEPAADSGGGTAEAAYDWQKHPVFIVGDSLTQGARKEIAEALPEATIDGKVNRNMAQGLTILQDWDESGVLADDAIIVVCLANNITDATLGRAQEVVDMIEPGQSLIMMTGHGRSNMEPVNEFIRELPANYGYITLADWDLTIVQSPGLLSDDGVHISKKQGNELYADLIVRALEATRPKE